MTSCGSPTAHHAPDTRSTIPCINRCLQDPYQARARPGGLGHGDHQPAGETIDRPIGATKIDLEQQEGGEFSLGNLVVDAMLAGSR